MADLEQIKQNVLSSDFDSDIYANMWRTNHFRGRDNQQAQDHNNAMLDFYYNQQDKLFQIMMKEQEQAYNSPSAQKQRFLEAGINPYLAMYGGASNTTGTPSTVTSSHSPSSGGAYAAADAERMQSITGGLGQLNDSVSSYFKNLVMSEQAKQEQFKTLTQAQRYGAELRGQIADYENKESLTENQKQDLRRLKNENDVYEANKPALYQRENLTNNVLNEQAYQLRSQGIYADAQTKTENLMRDINAEIARKGLKVSDAQILNLRASASNFYQTAANLRQEYDYMQNHGLYWREQTSMNENRIMYENYTRLRDTYYDFVKQCESSRILSGHQANIARVQLKHMSEELQYNLNYRYGKGPGTFSSPFLSGVNYMTTQFGQIFGGNGFAAAAFLK